MNDIATATVPTIEEMAPSNTPAEFPLDDTTPTDRAMLIDQRESLLHLHGGVATEVVFDEVEVIPIEEFVTRDLEDIKQRNALTVIRDTLSNRCYLLYNDCAIRYKGAKINDVEVEDLAKKIRTSGTIQIYPNINHILVAMVDSADKSNRQITVQLDDFSFLFKDPKLGVEDKLFMPPLWFSIVTTSAGMVGNAYVCAVPETKPNCLDAQLCALPLPNIFSGSGNICQGVVKQNIALNPGATDGEIVNMMISRIFDSIWNTDLISDGLARVLGGSGYPAYEKLASTAPSVKARYDGLMTPHKGVPQYCDQLRVIAVLTQPTGWMDLDFIPLLTTTSKFLCSVQ